MSKRERAIDRMRLKLSVGVPGKALVTVRLCTVLLLYVSVLSYESDRCGVCAVSEHRTGRSAVCRMARGPAHMYQCIAPTPAPK